MSGSKLDFPQIIKRVYDPTTDSLKTIPSSETAFAIELDAVDGDSVSVRPLSTDVVTLLNAVTAGSDATSSSVSILNDRGYSTQLSWSGLTGTLDGVFVVQGSVDDVVYTNIPSGNVTLNSASGSFLFNSGDAFYKYFRGVYTKNGVTGGTITLKYTKKG